MESPIFNLKLTDHLTMRQPNLETYESPIFFIGSCDTCHMVALTAVESLRYATCFVNKKFVYSKFLDFLNKMICEFGKGEIKGSITILTSRKSDQQNQRVQQASKRRIIVRSNNLTFGSHLEKSDIAIPIPSIAQVHCVLYFHSDQQSKIIQKSRPSPVQPTTFINGRPLLYLRPTDLPDKAVIDLDGKRFLWRKWDENSEEFRDYQERKKREEKQTSKTGDDSEGSRIVNQQEACLNLSPPQTTLLPILPNSPSKVLKREIEPLQTGELLIVEERQIDEPESSSSSSEESPFPPSQTPSLLNPPPPQTPTLSFRARLLRSPMTAMKSKQATTSQSLKLRRLSLRTSFIIINESDRPSFLPDLPISKPLDQPFTAVSPPGEKSLDSSSEESLQDEVSLPFLSCPFQANATPS
jgi:hypothetical protein